MTVLDQASSTDQARHTYTTDPGMETPLSTDSTLYPKITQHIHEVVKELKRQRSDANPDGEVVLDPIPIIGTIKLHGTHADILVYEDDTVTFQSRNNPNLLTTADNYSFATSMSPKRIAILRLRKEYIDRWQHLNPSRTLDHSLPIIIAGEWIGEKIQKDVAISQLSKRFVIISIKINGEWCPDVDYADIEAPDDSIYNIARGGIYYRTLYPEDLQVNVEELDSLANLVAAKCPFAESFGVIGEGEGLVWKLVPWVSKPEMWFKTKGGRFKPNFAPRKLKQSADGNNVKIETAKNVVKSWCGPLRLEQAWDYLREKRIPRDMRSIGTFLKWLENDIFLEEGSNIADMKMEKQILKAEIIAIARPWYIQRFTEG